MLTIFMRRYNQLFDQFFSGQAPCSLVSCNKPSLARCVRELAILEFRAITREFLDEAKLLPLPNWNVNSFPANANVAPVELSAAKLFDLHLGAPDIPACDSFTSVNSDPVNCIATAHNTPLVTQQDVTQLPAGTINTLTNQVKALGVGSLNAYLAQLGASPVPYSSLTDNFLIDLHGSAAEYAFNFGILEQIYAQDSRSTSANATCNANIPFAPSSTSSQQFQNALNSFFPVAQTRTLCTLFQSMSPTPAGGLGGTYAFASAPPLHTHMFRQEAVTGSC